MVSRNNLALIEGVFRPSQANLDDLKQIARSKGIDPEIRALFHSMLATQPIDQALQRIRKAAMEAKRSGDRKAQQKVQATQGPAMYDLFKQGVVPEDAAYENFTTYWSGVAETAVAKKDAAVAEVAFRALEKHFAGDSRAINYVNGLRKKLGK